MISYNTSNIPFPKLSIVSFFIFIALLRLTPFDFYMSILLGFPIEINALGGGAFNFVNYISTVSLVALFIAKSRSLTTCWKDTWPFLVLAIIYVINAIRAPYTDYSWVFYQLIFLLTSLFVFIYVRKISVLDNSVFVRRTQLLYLLGIVFMLFCIYQILTEYNLYYYLEEFNHTFVNSLDDFGIMKQRYGYFLGFMLSYTLFMIKNPFTRGIVIAIILFSGFGIRSFVVGLIGASFLFSIKKPSQFLFIFAFSTLALYLLKDNYFDNIIYDTRFYSYANALNIIQHFPFGVGLGGYPIYTEEFSRQLFANFYNVNSILDYVPIAPESDYVHLFGSLGLGLGLIHLLIQIRIVWYAYRLNFMANSFEKVILFLFCFMTFFGISEDSMFTIYYWIFFGLASGIVSSLVYRRDEA